MTGPTDQASADATAVGGGAASAAPEPFLYEVAARLREVLHLSRDQHLTVWKQMLDLYAQESKSPPAFVRHLCEEQFVESLMHNEVFWAMTGVSVTRELYGRADQHLSAVYATAALVAARRDKLPLARPARAAEGHQR